MNFKEKKALDNLGIFGICWLVAQGIVCIMLLFASKPIINKELISGILIFFLLLGIAFLLFGIITVKESVPIEYELKEPLKIDIDYGFKPDVSIDKDLNGMRVINKDERMVENFAFKKGDAIKIKTIEEYSILFKNDKKDWRNARVYMTWKDKLIELPYEDIKEQEIDKLLISLCNKK